MRKLIPWGLWPSVQRKASSVEVRLLLVTLSFSGEAQSHLRWVNAELGFCQVSAAYGKRSGC